MKKNLILLLGLSLLILVGCGNKDKYQDIMKEYATDYYEKYMKDITMNEYVITLDMLENANEKVNSNYDLSKLDKCEDTSSVTITLSNDEYKYSYDLKCEK